MDYTTNKKMIYCFLIVGGRASRILNAVIIIVIMFNCLYKCIENSI